MLSPCYTKPHPLSIFLTSIPYELNTGSTLLGEEVKLDAKTFIPLPFTVMDEMSGLDYDAERMNVAIRNAIKYPMDALIVSIPDYDVLREPIMLAKASGIPVIAVYSGLQAAKEMGILSVMADDFESGRLIGQQFIKDGKTSPT